MGIENTDGWLREIAKYTGKEKEVEKLIADEHAIWVPKLDAIRKELVNFKGDGTKMSVLGSLGQGRLLAQTPFFHELGLDPTAAIAQDFDNLILKETEDLIEKRGDFDILINTFQAAEQAHLTRKLDPDIALTCPFQGPALSATRDDSHPLVARRSTCCKCAVRLYGRGRIWRVPPKNSSQSEFPPYLPG